MSDCQRCGTSFYHCEFDHLANDPPLPNPGRCCEDCEHEDWESKDCGGTPWPLTGEGPRLTSRQDPSPKRNRYHTPKGLV
jgi:hypothetical protein